MHKRDDISRQRLGVRRCALLWNRFELVASQKSDAENHTPARSRASREPQTGDRLAKRA
ncbi:uncharacterized protein METZ01_LOCUS122253 [marine metagenome]|uniref:Uncharacterized protein n=1 Tax=marine metagenome TaxID=408172 RepID=A0A381XXA6_9ZZZZ